MSKCILKEHYKSVVVPELQKKFGYTNIMQVPRIVKVVISSGIGTSRDRDFLTEAVRTLDQITGQKCVITKARKSISNFKLREEMPVGCRVTLRRQNMYDFLYRLINIALPRVRDFRGVSAKAFDGSGNYSMGLTEQSIFTEIDLDKSKHTIGMNIAVVTTANSDEEARELLRLVGMPFNG